MFEEASFNGMVLPTTMSADSSMAYKTIVPLRFILECVDVTILTIKISMMILYLQSCSLFSVSNMRSGIGD